MFNNGSNWKSLTFLESWIFKDKFFRCVRKKQNLLHLCQNKIVTQILCKQYIYRQTIRTVANNASHSHLVRIRHLELPAVPRPGDEGLTGLVGEELQDELPELDGPGGRDGGPAALSGGGVAQAARQLRRRRWRGTLTRGLKQENRR